MTRLLVRVVDADDAAIAARAGADIAELAIAEGRAEDAGAVRAAFPGRLRLSFPGCRLTPEVVETAARLRADEIALPLEEPSAHAVEAIVPASLDAVAVVPSNGDPLAAVRRARGRVGAVMLEAPNARRLVDEIGIARLDAFATECRAAGLAFGLAGGLEAPDVSRLLLLDPDVLGFDAAVRAHHSPDGTLDPDALHAIRDLVPRHGAQANPRPDKVEVIDRIFVRDFVVPLAIGAYQAEHGARQRVRFSVEADVVRHPVPPRDMRDVFSYDVIIETIRVLAERAHVTFVETLAEEVAASILTHPSISAVKVKVEKLDVIDGIVGIETIRRRPA